MIIAGCLAIALGCDTKGSDSAPVVAVTVAPPVVTAARDSIALSGTAHVSTQAQPGCTYTWSIIGDDKARIGFGQGTNAISVSGFSAGGQTIQVAVTVQAKKGGSSAQGSTSINVMKPVEGQI